MSFNKRYLSESGIRDNINDLSSYIGNPDAIITTDDFSREVYRMFSEDVSDEEIIKYIKNMDNNKEHVNHPTHYGGQDNPYEAIKVIDAWDLGFSLGNTVKYISRAGKKETDKELQDLKKALWYLQHHIEELEKKTN